MLYRIAILKLVKSEFLLGGLKILTSNIFTGNTFFEHELPIDSSSMTTWRKYLESFRCGENAYREYKDRFKRRLFQIPTNSGVVRRK